MITALSAKDLRACSPINFELVAMVEDGREMVAAAKKLQPDVIVADISMPRLNGIEALTGIEKGSAAS